MLTNHVAIVPYEVYVPGEQLLHVTAALQTQVIRDVGPLWGVSCVVSAFQDLEQVPPGYLPVVIVAESRIEDYDQYGFHLTAGGQPIAIVEHVSGWSLLASHEMIELACDPFGTKTVRGTSLRDEKCKATAPDVLSDADETYALQGQVEYLVEVCDPCQASTYTINGVLVSDFVTPQYYDPLKATGGRYSYTGLITEPRQLLKGGYLTWRTRTESDEIWQAYAPIADDEELDPLNVADLTIGRLTGIAPTLARNWVDYQSAVEGRPGVPKALTLTETRGPPTLPQAVDSYQLAKKAAKHYGSRLRRDIEDVFESLAALRPLPDPEKLLALFEELAEPRNQQGRDAFEADPGKVLVEHEIDVPDDLAAPLPKLPYQQYENAAKALKGNDRFGPDLGPVGIAKILPQFGVFPRP